MKVIVFDIGGTLMEYNGMPLSWLDFYKPALEFVRSELGLGITDDDIDRFFASMNLTARIYPETFGFLDQLKSKGYQIAALTDIAIGMPDELHKSYFTELLPYFDMYVSSISCGYRKPNPKGLQDIADYFGVTTDEIIMIGDEEKDVKTGKRFGCMTVLVDRRDRNADFEQDYTITDLNGLWKVLE